MADSTTPNTTTETSTPSTTAKPPLTDRISDPLQAGIKVLIGSNRRPPRLFKSLLHGTWFGHPLHPALTDVPVAAWLLTAVFDVLWLVSPQTRSWAPRGAEFLVAAGVLGGLGSFVTGIADWSDSYGAERTVGLYHGLLNSSAIILYAVSFYLRFGDTSGQSTLGAIIGFVGLGCVLVAAYLGGDM